MPSQLRSILILPAALVVGTLLLASSASGAPGYKVLHAFGMGNDGAGLWGSLALDAKDNIFGTTSGGGTHGHGIVFELVSGSAGWSEEVLHNFPSGPNDGQGPTSGLIFDADGHLYGTTGGGGGDYTYGTVFRLMPEGNHWKEAVIHRFRRGDGAGGSPHAGLTRDAAGNLYGIAYGAFELSPEPDGRWKETVLHEFTGKNGDGSGTWAGLTLDPAGNLYGTTPQGGGGGCGGGCGISFELHRKADGKWAETITHTFGIKNGDGESPGLGALAIDGSGNLYGTTAGGGSSGYGTVFRLTLGSNGHWKETVLYSFEGGTNGVEPSAGVVMDRSGNLYGTTIAGGDNNCGCGLVYKLSPRRDGKWKYTVLHTFTGSDGAQPDANLILDGKGNLYGTTATGGTYGGGVAFEITP